MADHITHYDYVIGALSSQDDIDAIPMYSKVHVEYGDKDSARQAILDAGGVINDIDEHKAGVTITFEAMKDVNIK
jgi:hypothetical protein